MNIIKRIGPLFQRSILVIFNTRALHKAFRQQLLSWEFLIGFTCWALSAGIILLQLWVKRPLPELPLVLLVLFSLFTGCCWVFAPISVYLGRRIDQWMHRSLRPHNRFQLLTGTHLWHQAAQGKLSLQLAGTLLLGILLWFVAFQWTLGQPWQAWMVVAFFVNALFFVVFPFLIFLEAHIH